MEKSSTKKKLFINRPSKIMDKEGRKTLLTYDSMWNLARVTAPDGARTTFVYDALGRVVEVNGEDTAVWIYGIPKG